MFGITRAVDTCCKMGTNMVQGVVAGISRAIANGIIEGVGCTGSEFGNAFTQWSAAVAGQCAADRNQWGNAGKDVAQTISAAAEPVFQLMSKYSMRFAIGFGLLGLTNYGSRATIDYIKQRCIQSIGRPKLAIEWVKAGKRDAAARTASPCIFNKEMTQTIAMLKAAISNTAKHNGFLPNILFFGPPGTGKTLVCKKIAREANVNFILMSGGDLPQYIKRGEHISELNKLFEAIKTSKEPTLLFIDECESLCGKRGEMKSEELVMLQDALLNHTGEGMAEISKKLILCLATNRKEDLDDAMMSRMDHKIFVGPPACEERKRMICEYAPLLLKKEDLELFTAELVAKIALKTEGMTGRTLFKMVNAMSHAAAASEDGRLTQAMIEATVERFVNQQKAG